MTLSILNDCLELRDSPLSHMKEYLKKINLTIFDKLINPEEKEEDIKLDFEPRQTILYILCAYSEESPMVILRQDDKKEKGAICDFLNIPEMHRNQLITLANSTVRSAVTEFIERFAGPQFKSYMFLRIQAADFDRDITNRGYTQSNGEVEEHWDSKEHGKAIAELSRILRMISEVEKDIKTQVKFMAGITEARNFQAKETKKNVRKQRTGRIEDSSLIK